MPKRDADDLDEIDDELDLPPPDDDAGDEAEDHADEDVADLREEGLDDAEAADLDVGGDELETDDEESAEDEREVDVGALDDGLLVDGEEATTGAEPEGPSDDDGVMTDEEEGHDDGGAEDRARIRETGSTRPRCRTWTTTTARPWTTASRRCCWRREIRGWRSRRQTGQRWRTPARSCRAELSPPQGAGWQRRLRCCWSSMRARAQRERRRSAKAQWQSRSARTR